MSTSYEHSDTVDRLVPWNNRYLAAPRRVGIVVTIIKSKQSVREIVECLRKSWPNDVSNSHVDSLTEKLNGLRRIKKAKGKSEWTQIESKYVFDDTKYPELLDSYPVLPEPPERPTNLAEALLWKDGNWRAYQQFVTDHAPLPAPDASERKQIVYYAFARHLRSNKELPIFDQHSARALWAISESTWQLEYDPFRNFLFEGRGENEHWKKQPGGAMSFACWQAYCDEIAKLSNTDLKKLDELLMPLGQALKNFTDFDCSDSKYENFCDFFGVAKREKVRAPRKKKAKTST